MSAAAPAAQPPSSRAPSAQGTGRWLFGPAPDLLLGCGVGYAFVFVAMVLMGPSFRGLLPAGIALLPINLISSAHYGATAVRAYERAEDRRAYLFFTVWTTIALGACFVWGLGSVAAGSWIITVYLTWSPWHYALQNFGIAMTFLRRRAVPVTPGARRALHLSFVLSFLLAAVALHASDARTSYAPNQLESGVYAFVPLGSILGVPAVVADVLLGALAVAWLGATFVAGRALRRGSKLADLVPTFVLVGTQALWFSVPVIVRQAGWFQNVEPLSITHAGYAFLWVGAGHAVQYLWITAYFARRSGNSRSHAGFVTKSLLAGTALWYVPALLFAPGLLGRLPYDAGLAAMVAALVNLHHFVLDGVIWKLRDSRIARVLVGGPAAPSRAPGAAASATPSATASATASTAGQSVAEPAAESAAPAAWRVALWSGGTLILLASAASVLLTEFGFNRRFEAGDLDGARLVADRLDTLGQASAEMRLRLGHAYLARGQPGDATCAEACLQRSVEILPTAWAWSGLGDLHARRGGWVDAAAAYRRALVLDPEHPVATFHLAEVELQEGRLETAWRGLVRARALAAKAPDATPELHAAIDQALTDPRFDSLR